MKGCVGVLSLAVLVLSGCGMGVVGGAPGSGGGTVAGGLVVQGKVHGGQQPVAGSKVSLWTVGTTGYGLSPVQLTSTFTDNSGNFALPAPSCAQASELTYLTAVGGSPGGTANPANAQISPIAAIGPCSGAAIQSESQRSWWRRPIAAMGASFARASGQCGRSLAMASASAAS